MRMQRLKMIKPKRSVRIALGMKKMWSLSIHWMMKVSSQKQVSAVHTEMDKNMTLEKSLK